jgi:hypothetical protein
MAANMWKNSLKNVESDNNKILYETLLNFFYSETALTFWISLLSLLVGEGMNDLRSASQFVQL